MKKKGLKQLKKSIPNSFWVRAAPESQLKYTTADTFYHLPKAKKNNKSKTMHKKIIKTFTNTYAGKSNLTYLNSKKKLFNFILLLDFVSFFSLSNHLNAQIQNKNVLL